MAGAMKQELSEVILRIPVSLERGGVNELLSDSTAAVDRGEKNPFIKILGASRTISGFILKLLSFKAFT